MRSFRKKKNTDFEEYTIPSSTWVVFSGEGSPKSVQDLGRRVIMEWLPLINVGFDSMIIRINV